MNLPNYFIGDLPAETRLSAATVASACETLRKNRERFLAGRTTETMIHFLSELAAEWLLPEFPFRRLALSKASETPFSASTLETGINDFFQQCTRDRLLALVRQEFGCVQALDQLTHDGESGTKKTYRIIGPELLVHITSGHIPNPVWTHMIFGLLLRSAQFIKCARGTSLLPRLFAHSIYERERKLGACLEIAEWPGGTLELEELLFKEADFVTASGHDETIKNIRSRLPIKVRLAGYGDRVSFGYITRESLSSFQSHQVAERAAKDVIAWNQLGCLSPHLFYVEPGGKIAPDQFAEMLASELAKKEEMEPRGELSVEIASAIATRRAVYQMRAANSLSTRQWHSPNSTAWTVIYETDPRFQSSCLHRFVYIKPINDVAELLRVTEPLRGQISTVGLAAEIPRLEALANELAQAGIPRICPIGKMQTPPLHWRHDGRPPLADWVTWIDWEKDS